MISAQCDELRRLASTLDTRYRYADDIATALREAADTIWDLRNRCADLVDERERLFQANVEKNGEVLRLVAENAKLRELVKRYHRLVAGTDELWSWQSVYAELQELGIEVDK